METRLDDSELLFNQVFETLYDSHNQEIINENLRILQTRSGCTYRIDLKKTSNLYYRTKSNRRGGSLMSLLYDAIPIDTTILTNLFSILMTSGNRSYQQLSYHLQNGAFQQELCKVLISAFYKFNLNCNQSLYGGQHHRGGDVSWSSLFDIAKQGLEIVKSEMNDATNNWTSGNVDMGTGIVNEVSEATNNWISGNVDMGTGIVNEVSDATNNWTSGNVDMGTGIVNEVSDATNNWTSGIYDQLIADPANCIGVVVIITLSVILLKFLSNKYQGKHKLIKLLDAVFNNNLTSHASITGYALTGVLNCMSIGNILISNTVGCLNWFVKSKALSVVQYAIRYPNFPAYTAGLLSIVRPLYSYIHDKLTSSVQTIQQATTSSSSMNKMVDLEQGLISSSQPSQPLYIDNSEPVIPGRRNSSSSNKPKRGKTRSKQKISQLIRDNAYNQAQVIDDFSRTSRASKSKARSSQSKTKPAKSHKQLMSKNQDEQQTFRTSLKTKTKSRRKPSFRGTQRRTNSQQLELEPIFESAPVNEMEAYGI